MKSLVYSAIEPSKLNNWGIPNKFNTLEDNLYFFTHLPTLIAHQLI